MIIILKNQFELNTYFFINFIEFHFLAELYIYLFNLCILALVAEMSIPLAVYDALTEHFQENLLSVVQGLIVELLEP